MLPAHCTTPTDTRRATGRVDTPSVSADVLAVVPAGASVAGSQGAFLRAVEEHPDATLLRADAGEQLRAVAWVLASTASWTDLTARPTWLVLQERTGLSRASVARWLAWLRTRRLLGVVESGMTPRYAPMALAKDAPNRAALYVLCVPASPVDAAVEAAVAPELPVSVEESDRRAASSGRTHLPSRAAEVGRLGRGRPRCAHALGARHRRQVAAPPDDRRSSSCFSGRL